MIFSIFFGTACAAIGERAKPLITVLDSLAHVMLKITGYVMLFAPVAVFAAVAGLLPKVVLLYWAPTVFYAGVLFGNFAFVVGVNCSRLYIFKMRIFSLLSELRLPTLLAFSTASSEAAYQNLGGFRALWGAQSHRFICFTAGLFL